MPEQKMIPFVVGGLALGALLVYYRRQSNTSQKTELELIYFDIEGILFYPSITTKLLRNRNVVSFLGKAEAIRLAANIGGISIKVSILRIHLHL